MLVIAFILFLAYLLGSSPTSVWLGKAFKGTDLRKHGSGNAGTTNAFRVLGKPIGIIVLIVDMGKGLLAVSLSFLQSEMATGSESLMILRIGLGVLAVIGHIFPVFAGFKGGKGVATMAGVGLALHPLVALAAMGVYLLIFLISRVSALGSLTAVFSYPLWMIFVFQTDYRSLQIFSIFVPILVIITHRSNIIRMLKGNENKMLQKKRKGET
jgi:glycerol-3-phosphate acyltransferase PlsY